MATYYPSATTDTLVTTARQLATSPAGTTGGNTSKTGKSTGWGILAALGSTAVWAAGASEPAFGDLHGFILDDTSLEGFALKAGAVSGSLSVSTSSGTITGVLHWRIGVRSSSGAFTEFVNMTSGSISITSTLAAKTLSGTAAADVTLGVGDKLYAQVELQITANTSASTTATTTLRTLSTTSETSFTVSTQSAATPQTATATGLGSSAAFGAPSIHSAISLTMTGLASSAVFGTATALPGSVTAHPSGLGSSTAFGAPLIAMGGVTVTAAGLTSSAAFGTANGSTVGGSQTATPTGLASSAAFGTPTISARVTIAVSGKTSSAGFGTPTAQPGPLTVAVAGLQSVAVFGAPGGGGAGGHHSRERLTVSDLSISI